MIRNLSVKDILAKKKEFYKLLDKGQALDSSEVVKVVISILSKLNFRLDWQGTEQKISILVNKLIDAINGQEIFRARIIADQIEDEYFKDEGNKICKLFSLETKHYLDLLKGGRSSERLWELAKGYNRATYYPVAKFLYQILLENDKRITNWAYNGLGKVYQAQGSEIIKGKRINRLQVKKVRKYCRQAIKFYSKAIETVDLNVVLPKLATEMSYVGIAKCYQFLKKYRLAAKNCEEAIKLNEDNYYAYTILSKIYKRLPRRYKIKYNSRQKIFDLAENKLAKMVDTFWINSLLAENQNRFKEARIYWSYLEEIGSAYSKKSREKLKQYY